MRRKVAVAVVAFLAAFSFAGVAFATHAITGEVVSANPSAKTLMITVPEQAMAFVAVEDPANRTQVPPLVKVQWPMMTFNGSEEHTNALGKLKPGDKVTVVYSPNYFEPRGKRIAQSIVKLPM